MIIRIHSWHINRSWNGYTFSCFAQKNIPYCFLLKGSFSYTWNESVFGEVGHA